MSSYEDTTAATNSPYAQQRLVSETCVDLFLIEMVDTICRTTAVESEADSEAMFYKLDSLGYAVGQRMVERLVSTKRDCVVCWKGNLALDN